MVRILQAAPFRLLWRTTRPGFLLDMEYDATAYEADAAVTEAFAKGGGPNSGVSTISVCGLP